MRSLFGGNVIQLERLDTPEISAEEIISQYELFRSSASTYFAQMAEDLDFFKGNQLTQLQKNYLESVGQPPEANNKIRPAAEQVLSNVASKAPEWDVTPVGKLDNRLASVYNALVDEIWYKSDGDVHFRNAVKSFIIKGLGYFYIYPEWTADSGLGGMRVKFLKPESVFVDPNTTLDSFSDASGIIMSDTQVRESMYISFPQYRSIIEDAPEDNSLNESGSGRYNRDDKQGRADIGQDHQETIRKYIHWSKVSVPKVKIEDSLSGQHQVYDREEYIELIKDPEYELSVNEGSIVEDVIYDTAVREVFVIGEDIAYDNVLPISEYPVIPACNEHDSTPYPVGDVRHAKSPQRMLNRTEALIMAHTAATTNFKIIYEDGAIEPDEMRKWSMPNAVIRANPNALSGNKIKEFSPSSISSQLFMEKSRYENDIEQIFGAYKYLQGDAAESPDTVGAAAIANEGSARKQNWKVLPLYDMLTRAGRILMEWIPYVYTEQRVVRLVNELGIQEDETLNKPYIEDMTGEVKKMFATGDIEADVRVVVGSTRARTPLADLQRDIGLLNAGIYDRTQVIINMDTDVDKEALIKRQGEIARLQQQVAQLQEELKQTQGDLQSREREVFHANMRAEISEATKPVASAQASLKATASLEESRQRDKTRQVGEDLAGLSNKVNSETQEESSAS